MPDVIINGSEGRLEGKYTQGRSKNSPAVLILHPHPLHGGTMNNKVTYTMYKEFAEKGFSALRFNFRGVGKSEGEFDSGIGEITDAATALDWLQLQNPHASCFWIAGFSFGAWISLQLLMRRPELENFVAISPPAGKYDFNFLSPCPAPGLVLQGDKDSVVSEDDVNNLVDKISKQRGPNIDYRVIFGADHFFRDKLDQLSTNLSEFIDIRLTEFKPKKIKRDRRRRKSMAEAEN